MLEKIEPLGLPVIDGIAHLDHVGAADHLVHGAEAQLAMILRSCSATKKK
jgi:hypothetical protein